jgi:Domain of unknown function (DUF4124)
MRALALVFLAALALPAQAQLYKCVDARGKVEYTDNPANCKSVAKAVEQPKPRPASPPPVAKSPAKAKGAPTKVAKQPELSAAQLAARCKTMREELDWLNSARGRKVEFHTERVAQVEQGLRACR